MIRSGISWVMDHKAVTCLSITLFAFVVATIAVAVQKDNAKDDLALCEQKLAILSTTTTEQPTVDTTPLSPTTILPPVDDDFYRLPGEVVPTSYKIWLNPDMVNSTFEGRNEIIVNVLAIVNEVIMHSNLLEINIVTLTKGETNIPVTHSFSGDKRELLIIVPDQLLEIGEYKIVIEYAGKLDGIVGFYSSSVSETKKIATSKFEPTYARQAFPCFDEPAMKARFSVELIRPKDYISLSNMDKVEEGLTVVGQDDLRMDRYRESVPMSTYLACFIVCDFIERNRIVDSGGIGENFTFAVYATDENIDKVQFPLEIGVDVTEYYIQHFNLSYPLPKLDMIAIPDFVSGAMEHWGLVTFRETNLLYDETTTSPANMQNIARVVAHEISHMWFGNLVTMNWWNDLWLNEGFASYMQYKALDVVRSDWKTMEQFISANTHSVMVLDATLSSHPIVQTVNTPDEITAIFDSISYNKGAAVLRMLEGFVGEENFKNGVSTYLEKNQYQNTVTQDLLDELAILFAVDNQDHNLTYIMDTWTRQMGLPVVNVAKKDATTYTLTQERFLADPDTPPETLSPYNDRWYIPVTYRTDKNLENIIWMPDTSGSVVLKIPDGDTLLKLNNDQVGYYRVNYDTAMWDTLKTEISKADTKLTTSDKVNIFNDVFSLADASRVDYKVALDISLYLKGIKEDYVPWAVASSQFNTLKKILSNSVAYLDFKTYVKSLLSEAYAFVTWEDLPADSHTKRLLRSVILNMACSMGHDNCLSVARTKFSEWIADKTAGENKVVVNPNIRSALYYYGIETTGEKEWQQLWDIYLNETDAQEKSKHMQALAASRDPVILQRYLTLAWDEKNVRSQDYFSVMQYISANPAGTSLVWDYFRENWEMISGHFTTNNRVLGTTVPAITSRFASAYKLEEMETFFAKYPDAGAGATAREQAKETVKNNINWLKKHEESVRTWLETQISA